MPRPRAASDPATEATAARDAAAATEATAAPDATAPDATEVRVVRFDRPLRTGTDSIGWADPRIRERIDLAVRQARQEAHGLGYAAGWAQGRRAAEEQARIDAAERAEADAAALREHSARARTLLQALGEAARQVARASVPAWTEVADAVTDGALAIARAALGRELEAVDAEVADAVRVALRTLAGPDEVTVHVHPRDLDLLRGLAGEGLAGEGLPEGVRFEADPSVPPGGVVAATPVQRLLRDLPAAVTRAEEVLRS